MFSGFRVKRRGARLRVPLISFVDMKLRSIVRTFKYVLWAAAGQPKIGLRSSRKMPFAGPESALTATI